MLRQRDTLAAPLRDLEACILAVRTGTFLPDVSRSGYFPSGAVAQNVAPSDEPSETPPGRTGASDIEPSVGMTWPDDTAADPLDSQADSPIFGEGHELEHPAASPSLAADEDAEGADKISASSSSSSSSSTDSEVKSEPGHHLAPLDRPVWRAGCQVWQHRQSRTGLFTCSQKPTLRQVPLCVAGSNRTLTFGHQATRLSIH